MKTSETIITWINMFTEEDLIKAIDMARENFEEYGIVQNLFTSEDIIRTIKKIKVQQMTEELNNLNK